MSGPASNVASGGHILWVGAQTSKITLRTRRAVSPAAQAWQHGLITATRRAGWQVSVLGHVPEPVWPRGDLFLPEETPEEAAQTTMVAYTNAPGWRQVSLARSYVNKLGELVEARGQLTQVVTWNWLPGTGYLVEEIRRRYSVPWICIAADLPPGRLSWKTLVERRADGVLYLPWTRFSQSPARNKIHLDGGIDTLHFEPGRHQPRQGPRDIVYAGTMAPYGGLGLLLQSLPHIRTRDCRIVVCGKGDSAALRDAASRDSRVHVAGFLPEDELHAVMAGAWAFVNPRPMADQINQGNFPSKILTYLAYGRPVVSTWTEGLSPEYRRVLVPVTEEGPAALGRAIDGVLEWDHERCDATARAIHSFMAGTRLWNVQARRFLCWLERADHETRDGRASQEAAATNIMKEM
jgi:glycosyltransferase involved in cell wall biosynthesis